MRIAERVANLPAYFFAAVNDRIAAKRAHGRDVISLGVGDPDLGAPPTVVEALASAARESVNHRYPPYAGLPEFRRAIAAWYRDRFAVNLDPDRQVAPLLGSKEGIAHASLALLDPNCIALVPDPGYPTYTVGPLLAGASCFSLPLLEENGYLPQLDEIPSAVLNNARVLWLNYPNNPTGATATPSFFEKVVDFASRHRLAVLHDNAYSEVTYGDYLAPSFLQTPGAVEVGAEFHSLSKTFNMAGWRVGMLVGNPAIIEAVGRLKGNIDTGMFLPVQLSAIAALGGNRAWIKERNTVYQRRRDRMASVFNGLGWACDPPSASLYLWGKVPKRVTAMDFALRVLEDADVYLTPGVAFGAAGEGYFRASVTVPDDRLDEALSRLRHLQAF